MSAIEQGPKYWARGMASLFAVEQAQVLGTRLWYPGYHYRLRNATPSIGSAKGDFDHRLTAFTKHLSNHRMTIDSRSHTPVVQIDKGPFGVTLIPMDSFSVVTVPSFSYAQDRVIPKSPEEELFLLRRIRFASTTSVKTRSPIITSSSSRIGCRREEKYVLMAVIHEYAGLKEWCCSTGERRWCDTDSDYLVVLEMFCLSQMKFTWIPPASRYVPAELLTMRILPSPKVSLHCSHTSCYMSYIKPLRMLINYTWSSGTSVSWWGKVYADIEWSIKSSCRKAHTRQLSLSNTAPRYPALRSA